MGALVLGYALLIGWGRSGRYGCSAGTQMDAVREQMRSSCTLLRLPWETPKKKMLKLRENATETLKSPKQQILAKNRVLQTQEHSEKASR